jgi:hypothetical protein
MEPKFQTSFIPKKTSNPSNGFNVAKSAHRGTSVYMAIAVIIFVISLGAVGAAYAWQQYLSSQQIQYKKDLADREKQFNTKLIGDLKQVNVQIDTAKNVLANHVALSQLFDVLQKLTIEKVRFTTLSVTMPGPESKSQNDLSVIMQGYGTNLSAVAFQSKVLSELEKYGLRQMVKNPIISNPSLEPAGSVAFGFTATLDLQSLTYAHFLSPTDTSAPASPGTPATAPTQ